MNITFVYDEIIVSTTVEGDDADQAVIAAAAVVSEYNLDPRRAFEIHIDGEIYDGPAL
jgi:hypothetical protein